MTQHIKRMKKKGEPIPFKKLKLKNKWEDQVKHNSYCASKTILERSVLTTNIINIIAYQFN